MKKNFLRALLPLLLALTLFVSSCGLIPQDMLDRLGLGETTAVETPTEAVTEPLGLADVPSYREAAYVAVNGNVPFFTDEEKKAAESSYETYAALDSLGRCGVAVASVGKDLMPSEERGSIGTVKPSGWQTVKYDNVDGQYLYNRCHLIGYQLTGENANRQNLITGTRYLNVIGMLPFENLVADYVKETMNHVLYRVTPVFNGDDLVALGVLMEGWSVEDQGAGVEFCVFCYNVQPGIVINYADGTSRLAEDGEELMTMWGGEAKTEVPTQEPEGTTSEPKPEQTLALVSVTDPVKKGEKARVEIKGTVGTTYSIRVKLPSGAVSVSAALVEKTADENGTVVWEWEISKNTGAGQATVTVTGGGETLETSFVIAEADAG